MASPHRKLILRDRCSWQRVEFQINEDDNVCLVPFGNWELLNDPPPGVTYILSGPLHIQHNAKLDIRGITLRIRP